MIKIHARARARGAARAKRCLICGADDLHGWLGVPKTRTMSTLLVHRKLTVGKFRLEAGFKSCAVQRITEVFSLIFLS